MTADLRRPAPLYFDLETTGLDPDAARNVELAAVDEEARAEAAVGAGQTELGLGWEPTFLRRYHPGVPIPDEAARVHGITDRDVAHAPRFADEAAEVQRMFEGRLLCGYNLRSFDTPRLDAELRRCGPEGPEVRHRRRSPEALDRPMAVSGVRRDSQGCGSQRVK